MCPTGVTLAYAMLCERLGEPHSQQDAAPDWQFGAWVSAALFLAQFEVCAVPSWCTSRLVHGPLPSTSPSASFHCRPCAAGKTGQAQRDSNPHFTPTADLRRSRATALEVCAVVSRLWKAGALDEHVQFLLFVNQIMRWRSEHLFDVNAPAVMSSRYYTMSGQQYVCMYV